MALHRPQAARPRALLDQQGRALPPPPRIDDPELEAMRAAERAVDASLHPFAERGLRRLKIYVIGSVVFFPLMTWVFTPAGLGMLWLQLLIAAAYGAYLAWVRPGGLQSALATLLAGVITQSAAGTPTTNMHGFLFTLGLFLY
ncbi:MAG: hypothetical protein O2894_09725, partial [Planctomycetota bacterium]|nr:hypothetical protein [Planctomycetota bacterium]